MQDTTILYHGGSGGFLFYYYMLLSGEYTTGLDMDKIEEYIENQFHPKLANDKKSWKIGHEYWPDNKKCKETITDKPKLFLICNTYFYLHFSNENIKNYTNNKIILLYTDLHTQLRMCYNKKAAFFTEEFLKDPSRPFYNQPDKKYIRHILKSGVMWNNELCYFELPRYEKIYPNLELVKLRDLIQNYPKNTKQQWLIDRWLSLHTKKELRHLL